MTLLEKWVKHLGGNQYDIIDAKKYTQGMNFTDAVKHLKNIWELDNTKSTIALIKTDLDVLYESRDYVAKNRHLVLDPEASAQISRMGAHNATRIADLEAELKRLENV